MAHPARIRLFHPGQHLDQGGFPAAVDPHHPNAVAGLHPQAHLVQQGFQPEGFVYVLQIDEVNHLFSFEVGTARRAGCDGGVSAER